MRRTGPPAHTSSAARDKDYAPLAAGRCEPATFCRGLPDTHARRRLTNALLRKLLDWRAGGTFDARGEPADAAAKRCGASLSVLATAFVTL